MQFHLNGFVPGDPVAPPHDRSYRDTPSPLPAEVDVLIIGSGPAGLTLATQLAVFPDIVTRLVEEKAGPIELGQADGIACRTMEMFNAFGFADRVLREAYWVNETSFWKPDQSERGTIARSGRVQDSEDGLSEFPHVILNQARIHDFYLDAMRAAPRGLTPDYACRLRDVMMSAEDPDGRVTVGIERLDSGTIETVRARYVIGCDGARSRVRAAIGRPLRGDAANQAWGVMDVLAVTDFPDVRLKAAIHSAHEGSILIIPREGGYLVRFYVELDKLNPDERVSARGITIDQLIAAAQRILHPYTLDVKEVAWWSVYEIGQRLCDRFDDLDLARPDDGAPRVFITGDACHTHSPKAGQGMNVSMQDSFNLGWKLAAVIQKRSDPAILRSYSVERHAIAQELIEFDRAFARMFSMAPRDEANPDGIDPAEFQEYFVRQGRFTAGVATRYRPSILVGGDEHQALATGFPIGMRFHSAPVIRLADARPMELGHIVEADGRWRLIAFAGAGGAGGEPAPIDALLTFLATAKESPLYRFTPAGADPDSVIDVRVVFPDDHRQEAPDALPPSLLPRKGRFGLIDYEKAFCRDARPDRDIYALRGIDRALGCVVIVRPDQYVAHVLPLTAHDALAAFFVAFMRTPVAA